jgi:hypothetical protein
MKVRFSLALVVCAMVPITRPANGQTWTFQGSQVCYTNNPQLPNPSGFPIPQAQPVTQCVSSGTMQALYSHFAPTAQAPTVSAPPDPVESARALGAEAGALVALLVRTWVSHHQAEETDQLSPEERVTAYALWNTAFLDESAALISQQNHLFDAAMRNTESSDEIAAQNHLIDSITELRKKLQNRACSALLAKGREKRSGLRRELKDVGGAAWFYGNLRSSVVSDYVTNRAVAVFSARVLAAKGGNPKVEPPPVFTILDETLPCTQ